MMMTTSARKSPFNFAAAVVRGNSAFLILTVILTFALAVKGQQSGQGQTCPASQEINPCICTVKKNGLDILCEFSDLNHINKAMAVLKPKSPIIFYLKLRHNNLPKLQGFIFLSLDIRHLTIHNSSLAVIEETSLSSLGESNHILLYTALSADIWCV
jgi:hypothetical protein